MHVRTVLGDISPQQLGTTTCHEHLLWTVPESFIEEDPDLGLDSVPAAVSELRHFHSMGGTSLVEMTTVDIGRCPCELAQISLATDVHIIAATGHHKAKFSSTTLVGQSVDDISRWMITEVTTGMIIPDAEHMGSIRAGVIKAATSQNAASESELRVIQAAGRAHQETGAPVSTHSEGGTFAVEQVHLLLDAGVNPNKLCIGHMDFNPVMEICLRLADLGVYLGFDQVGKEKYWRDAERVRLIMELNGRGYLRQILLSGDTERKSAWRVHNPRATGIAHLLTDFIPELVAAGASPEILHTLLVENPAAFLAF